MLPDGAVYLPARHVQPLVVPLAIESLKLAGDPVVFSHHDRVQDAQAGILGGS